MKKIFLLFLITFYFQNIFAQGNNKISWSVFDNGFALQNNSSTTSFSLIGQPAVGISASNNNKVILGFLSELAIRGSVTSSDDPTNNIILLVYDLYQNYPNPFNPTTTIKYTIPQTSFITLKVFDILGREVAVLVNEEKPAGSYEVDFNASQLSSGVYIYQLKSGSFIQIKKMVLIR